MSSSPTPESFPTEDFDYRLIDSGDFRKLERFGPHLFIRPALQAIWPRQLPESEWRKADGEFRHFKGKGSGGAWTFSSGFSKEGWPLRFQNLVFRIQPTRFGHFGLFPEQAPNWIWLATQVRNRNAPPVNLLNVFGYTGAATLAAAAAGARVTHVDASKTTVQWARTNQELSGLSDRPIRWIVDDVLKFLKREYRRGNRYDGILLDPPSFGRGTRGEVWKFEKNLPELLTLCRNVLSDQPLFFLLTTHSPGFSGLALKNLLLSHVVESEKGKLESGEMFIFNPGSPRHLPNGFFSRWSAHS